MLRKLLRDESGVSRILTGIVAGLVALFFYWLLVTFFTDRSDGDEGYTDRDRAAFVQGCKEGLDEATCACAFDYMKERVPYDDYKRADRYEDPARWPANVRRVAERALAEC